MNRENLVNVYITENKIVILSSAARVRGGGKGKKTRSNFCKLLKTDIEKMPVFRLSMMLMKANELSLSLQDVDENKGG